MKIRNLILLSILAVSGTSCADFLDKPINGQLNADSYYMNEEQCKTLCWVVTVL